MVVTVQCVVLLCCSCVVVNVVDECRPMVLVVRFQAFRVRVRNMSLGKMSRLELSRAPFVCECVHTMAFFSCALSLAFFYV